MKIAIIDCINQDIGLKILFPEADYYIHNEESCTIDYRQDSYQHYHFTPNTDWTNIHDENYDCLCIVVGLRDAYYDNIELPPHIVNIKHSMKLILDIIDKNTFQKILVFDNYDYDYDPYDYIKHDKITFYFKRNYNSKKTYHSKTIPFPYITFGPTAIIEKCDRDLVSEQDYFKQKTNQVFFSGALLNHSDPIFNVYRNRNIIYNDIRHLVFNPGYIPNHEFMRQMRNSKFGLDLLGVGEPNTRTFEILLSGALLLSEKNDLRWNFEERFSPETIFQDSRDFIEKLNRLNSDDELYNRCLKIQYSIVKKYFNVEWLRKFVLDKITDL